MNIFFMLSLILVCFLTAALSGVTGLGGGVILLSFMSFAMPMRELVPIHGLLQLVSNGWRALLLRREIRWKLIWPFLLGPFLGAALVAKFVMVQLPERVPLLLMGAIIFYSILRPQSLPSLKMPAWAYFPLGVVLGGLGVLVGATGPFMGAFFVDADLSKEEGVATRALMMLAVHLAKIPAYVYLDFEYGDYLPSILLLSFFTVLGTHVGVKILHRIPLKLFTLIFRVTLGLAGARLILKAI